FDPVARVGTEAGSHRRIEALDSSQKSQISLFDQVLQSKAFAGVSASNVDDQPEVGANHSIASLYIAIADGDRKFLLLRCVQERRFIDFAKIGFERRLDGRGRPTAGGWHIRWLSFSVFWPNVCCVWQLADAARRAHQHRQWSPSLGSTCTTLPIDGVFQASPTRRRPNDVRRM